MADLNTLAAALREAVMEVNNLQRSLRIHEKSANDLKLRLIEAQAEERKATEALHQYISEGL